MEQFPKSSLKQIMKSWTKVLIEGRLVDRKRFKPPQGAEQNCDLCNVSSGKLHELCCPRELSPCLYHQFLNDCLCNVNPQEGV